MRLTGNACANGKGNLVMKLQQWLESTPVAKLNLRDPVTIAETSTVREAVQAMRDARLGCIVAVNRENEPTGIFTEAMLRNRLNDSPGALERHVVLFVLTNDLGVLPELFAKLRDLLESGFEALTAS